MVMAIPLTITRACYGLKTYVAGIARRQHWMLTILLRVITK